jgi:hypothetical protein
VSIQLPVRTVPGDVAMQFAEMVRYGVLSDEQAMRHLFPEEAAEIYNPGRWPWGPPQEKRG